jgi:predicted Zn finger-like uncharacterized protein
MKIACQSCQAKYTIADEKVLGRVVKIRCKKCGATIVINGNESADAGGTANEEATQAMPNSRAAFDYAAQSNEEPWTVNVADGDQRTLSTAEIVAQFKAGVVNDETYCWRDGMGDWLPLREIDVLVGACGLGGGGAAEAPPQYSPPAQQQAAYAAPAAAMGGGGGGLGALFGGGDPGAYAAPPAESNGNGAMHAAPLAARRAGGRPGGVDLFGTAAEAGGENDVMTSAPQGAPAMHGGTTDSKLTGERNENSVLFSLNALTQNAPKKDDIPGPQGDGSGLIDIRALSANMAPQTKKQNHVDDIMNLGGGGAFSAALAAPVLAPPSADAGDVYGGASTEGGKSNKMMFILAGIGVLIVGLLLVVLLRPKGDTPTTAASGTTPTATATTGAGATASVAANDTPPPPPAATADPGANAAAAAPTGAAPVDPTKSAVASNAGTSSGSGSSSRRSSGGGGGAAAPVIPAAPPAAPAAAPKSFDDALKSAAGGGSGGGAPAAPAESTAPFDRGAAAGALGAVNVGSCKRPDGPTGSGHVSVTFAPNGSVSSAVADQPPFAGTPVGGCVAGKFRSAHIPAFGGGSVKVGKSFVIN